MAQFKKKVPWKYAFFWIAAVIYLLSVILLVYTGTKVLIYDPNLDFVFYVLAIMMMVFGALMIFLFFFVVRRSVERIS